MCVIGYSLLYSSKRITLLHMSLPKARKLNTPFKSIVRYTLTHSYCRQSYSCRLYGSAVVDDHCRPRQRSSSSLCRFQIDVDCALADVNVSYAPLLLPPIGMGLLASKHRAAIVLLVVVFCMRRYPLMTKFSVDWKPVSSRCSFRFLKSLLLS